MASSSGCSTWDQLPVVTGGGEGRTDFAGGNKIEQITSKFNWEHKALVWTVENISEAVGRMDKTEVAAEPRTRTLPHEYFSMLDIDYINSNPFEAGSAPHNKSVWSLSLYKQGGDPQFLGVFLHLLEVGSESDASLVNRRMHHNHSFDDYDSSELYFKYQMSVLNSRGIVIHSIQNNTIINISPGGSWGEDQFIPLTEVRDPKSQFVSGDKLTLRIDLWLFQQLNHNVTIQEQRRVQQKNAGGGGIPETPRNDVDLLRKLWESRDFADVTIKCGDKSFAVHKCIIASSSAVFNAMFTNQMSEASNNLVTINGTDPSVLEIMLTYLYTKEISQNWDWNDFDKVMELVDASEKYAIKELKELCFETICDRMNMSNIGEIALLAHLYNADGLTKSSVYDFIISNIKILQKQENFTTLVAKNPAAFAPIILSPALLNN